MALCAVYTTSAKKLKRNNIKKRRYKKMMKQYVGLQLSLVEFDEDVVRTSPVGTMSDVDKEGGAFVDTNFMKPFGNS